MKNNIDLWAVGVGVVGAFLKGVKHRMDFKTISLGMVVAGILSFGTIGLLDIFFSNLEPRIVILISFSVGWVANELTDVLDKAIKDGYEIGKQWASNKFTKKK